MTCEAGAQPVSRFPRETFLAASKTRWSHKEPHRVVLARPGLVRAGLHASKHRRGVLRVAVACGQREAHLPPCPRWAVLLRLGGSGSRSPRDTSVLWADT